LVYPYDVNIMSSLEQDQAHAVVSADSGDEVLATMAFAALTSCANVSFETLPASAALNKKRAGKGRQPLFDVRVLMVGDSGALRGGGRHTQVQATGTHASPRTHLRRGHVRRLEDKTVWVNAALVNPAVQEAPVPRYRMERER
jgi:hypothetical protein